MQPVKCRKRARDDDGGDSPEKKVRNSQEEDGKELEAREAIETATDVDGEGTTEIAKEMLETKKRARDDDGGDSPEKKVRNSQEEDGKELEAGEAIETAMDVDGEETTKIAKEILETKKNLTAHYEEELQSSSDTTPLHSQLVRDRLRFRLMQQAGEEVLKDFDALCGRAHLSVPTAKGIQDAAQILIFRWWKRQVAGENLSPNVMKSFFAIGINPAAVRAMCFDELAARLREQSVLDAMSKAVQRVFYQSFGRRGTRRIAEANLNVRVFLAAYMIAYRPTFVFESQSGALEKDLKQASERLVTSFDRICEELREKSMHGVAREFTDDFPTTLHLYVRAFKAWKIPDENKLSGRIKHALAALYQAETQLEEDAGSYIRLEFQSQQERLRYKLMQVAGVQVLKDFDALRGRAHLPLPTGAVAASATHSAARVSGCRSDNMYSSLPGRMTNEQLAHELQLDPYFKLDDKGASSRENPVFARIREGFHVAFWDSLIDDMMLSPPCYVRVVRVLTEIRDGIADLACGTREENEINSVVDVAAIREHVDSGRLEWVLCVRLVEGIVPVLQRMQAPKRDAETAAQWSSMQEVLVQAGGVVEQQPAAFCKALEFVLERVNTIRVDAANARLRMIAPVVRIHGVEYERAQMEKRLKAAAAANATGDGSGPALLARTQKWMDEAVRAQVVDCKVSLASLVAGKADAFQAAHARAVLRLVTGEEALSAEQCPETLLLDLHRLQAAHTEFHFGVLGATMLVQLQQKKEVREALGCELPLIQDFFCSHTPRSACARVIETALVERLKESTPPLPPEILDVVVRTLLQSKDAANNVYGIFGGNSGRIAQLWAAGTGEHGMPESPPLPNVALCLIPRIKRHSETIKGVVKLNLQVHTVHYNKIIADCARALQQERVQQ